jgi:hypothetical protein
VFRSACPLGQCSDRTLYLGSLFHRPSSKQVNRHLLLRRRTRRRNNVLLGQVNVHNLNQLIYNSTCGKAICCFETLTDFKHGISLILEENRSCNTWSTENLSFKPSSTLSGTENASTGTMSFSPDTPINLLPSLRYDVRVISY